MEVYLNVAEMGEGIYGVEAASLKYFGCHASRLNISQAVCLACVLPNPLVRNPRPVPQRHRTKSNTIKGTSNSTRNMEILKFIYC